MYKILEENVRIEKRFTREMADSWAKAGEKPVNPKTGEPFKPGDVLSSSPGVKISAVTEDGEVLSSATCLGHPMTVLNFEKKVRRQADKAVRTRKLLARIEKNDFRLPNLSSAFDRPIIAAYGLHKEDAPPDIPEGWTLWSAYNRWDRRPAVKKSLWDLHGCKESGNSIEYENLEIFDYLKPGETLITAQNRLKETFVDTYVFGLGPIAIIRAVEGTPIPTGYQELSPDNKHLSPEDAHDIFHLPLEHWAGSYPDVEALDVVADSRTTCLWVRPVSDAPGARWICGCGIGSHTLQAPGTFETRTAAEHFAEKWRQADFVERVWESREKLISQDIAGMVRDIKPTLVVAGPTGSLWDAYCSTQAEDQRSQAVNHRVTAYSPGR